MFCHSCGNQLPDGAAFCSKCGTPVANQNQINNISYSQPIYNNTQNNYPASPQYTAPVNYQYQRTKGSPRKLIILIIVLLLAAAGGITAFFVLRKKSSGLSDPKDATKAFFDSLKSGDVDEYTKLIPDDILNLYISFKKDDFASIGVSNANDWNNMFKQLFAENDNYISDILSIDGTVEILDSKETTLDEALDILSENGLETGIIKLFLNKAISALGLENRFAIVDITITINGETQTTKDICYKYAGSWYSFSALSIPDSLIRYINKSTISEDIESAYKIAEAMSVTLHDEYSYNDLKNCYNSCPVFTAKSEGVYQLARGVNTPYAYDEFIDNCGLVSPKIKYTGKGQCGWAVGITRDGQPIVWISTEDDLTAYEIYPNTCSEYK